MSAIDDAESYRIRHDGFQANNAACLLFGVYTSLVLFTVHRLASKQGIKALLQGQAILMLLLYMCAIMHFSVIWNFRKRAFINHGNSKETVLEALQYPSLAETILLIVGRCLLMFMGDCIMIWRCWNLYGQSWAVVAIPVIFATAELGLIFARVIYQIRESTLSSLTAVISTLTVSFVSLTFATTIIVTTLIVYRIVRMGGFKRYRDIVSIIIESSALYTCMLVIYMPFPFHPVLYDTVPVAVLNYIPGISCTLIIARVSLGHGIEHTFNGNDNLAAPGLPPSCQFTSIQFQHTTVRTHGEDAQYGMSVTNIEDGQRQSRGITSIDLHGEETDSSQKKESSIV